MSKLIVASLIGAGMMLAQTPVAKNPVNDATQGAVKHHRVVKVKKSKHTVETDIQPKNSQNRTQSTNK